MISQRISFHERQNSRIGSLINIRIFGGDIAECRLREELPGRTWWKLAKTNVTVRVPLDLMRNFGVWNDENQV